MNLFPLKTAIPVGSAVLALFLSACGSDSSTGGKEELSSSSSEITSSSSSVEDSGNPLSSSSLNAESSSSITQESSSSGANPESSSSENNSSSSSLCEDRRYIDTFLPPTEFCDSRDGKYYPTVTIGTQIWMAANLNYVTESGSWCYEDDESNCDTYGRLYDWDTAMEVCPEGWHLPGNDEWAALVNFAGGAEIAGSKLKSATDWDGTNDYGFNALLYGYRGMDGNFYTDISHWWTATAENELAYHRNVHSNYNGINELRSSKGSGFSVRCVQYIEQPLD